RAGARRHTTRAVRCAACCAHQRQRPLRPRVSASVLSVSGVSRLRAPTSRSVLRRRALAPHVRCTDRRRAWTGHRGCHRLLRPFGGGCMIPQFVAEISSNHHRDLARALEFVDTAAAVGCDAVKFQLFRVSELFAPEILAQSPSHRARVAWELPEAFLEPIAERCVQRGIAFGCTPFHLAAVAQLRPYVAFYKVASYELLWTDLLAACGATGKPVVLSTGMATLGEVKVATSVLRTAGCSDLTLLHCVSGYPTPPSECNLAAIET